MQLKNFLFNQKTTAVQSESKFNSVVLSVELISNYKILKRSITYLRFSSCKT